MQPSNRVLGALKALVFALALIPLGTLAAGALFYPDWLGANPAEYITRKTGNWTLRFLLLTLAVTPLRRLTGWNWLLKFRRMLGLYAFFYAAVHFSSFISFDHVFMVDEILKDIVKRPFITVGFTALVLLIPLAATSTNAMVQRLGAKRWLLLHRLVYVIAPLGVLHFWWMVKRDVTQPALFGAILAVLLGYRIAAKARDARRPEMAANPGFVRPPVVLLASIAAGLALEAAWPLPLLSLSLAVPLGALLMAVAVALFCYAAGTFRAAGTPVPGNRPTTVIARAGPYRFSRNPIYLAFCLLQIGAASAVNSLWLILTLVPAAAVMACIAIPREERYLERNFGAEYLHYKASVRRWL